jgi:hypothetical protein
VIIAIFFEELEDGKVRVSMRSKDERADVLQDLPQLQGRRHKLAPARVFGRLGRGRATRDRARSKPSDRFGP